jgi:hypothetical protein
MRPDAKKRHEVLSNAPPREITAIERLLAQLYRLGWQDGMEDARGVIEAHLSAVKADPREKGEG